MHKVCLEDIGDLIEYLSWHFTLLIKIFLRLLDKTLFRSIVYSSNVLSFQQNISKDHFNVLVNDNFTPGLSFIFTLM